MRFSSSLSAVVVAVFVVAPTSLHAQRGPHAVLESAASSSSSAAHAEEAVVGPMDLVLTHRGEIGLTREQVVSVERIRDIVRERNTEVIGQIRAHIEEHRSSMERDGLVMGDAERERRVEEARAFLVPLVRQVMAHNLDAVGGLDRVLEEEQAEKAHSLLTKRRDELATSVFRPAPAEAAEDSGGH